MKEENSIKSKTLSHLRQHVLEISVGCTQACSQGHALEGILVNGWNKLAVTVTLVVSRICKKGRSVLRKALEVSLGTRALQCIQRFRARNAQKKLQDSRRLMANLHHNEQY